MFKPDEDGVYARVGASAPRRIFAHGVLLSLGALILYTTFSRPPEWHWMIFMIAFGVAVLWLAERMRRATRLQIELTDEVLRDSTGTILARLDDIDYVSRGVFALKPSNGFTLVTKSYSASGWAPGIWWRLGRRVGVGGVTSAGQARFMAEQIALRIKR